MRRGDLRSGDAFFKASFGATPKERLLADQRDGLGDDLQRTEPEMPERMDAYVGTTVRESYPGSKHHLLRAKMTSPAGPSTAQIGLGRQIWFRWRWISMRGCGRPRRSGPGHTAMGFGS